MGLFAGRKAAKKRGVGGLIGWIVGSDGSAMQVPGYTRLIDCPEAYQLAEELYRENEDRYVLSADEDFRELSYRSLRIAYDRAVMIYLMEGCQWSEEIATFMRWLMEYDLWVKLYYFSDELWDIRHQANGHTSDPKDLLSTWMKRGHISYDETTGMYQKKRRD